MRPIHPAHSTPPGILPASFTFRPAHQAGAELLGATSSLSAEGSRRPVDIDDVGALDVDAMLMLNQRGAEGRVDKPDRGFISKLQCAKYMSFLTYYGADYHCSPLHSCITNSVDERSPAMTCECRPIESLQHAIVLISTQSR